MTGYRGRAGLYELLQRRRGRARGRSTRIPTSSTLRKQAVADGMRPLRLAGMMKVAEGLTTVEEVLRTTPSLE